MRNEELGIFPKQAVGAGLCVGPSSRWRSRRGRNDFDPSGSAGHQIFYLLTSNS